MNYSFANKPTTTTATTTKATGKQELEKRRFLIFGSENYIEHKALFDEVCCQKCFELTLKMCQCKNCNKVYCSNCFPPQGQKKHCPNCNYHEETLLPNQKLMTLNQILFKCRYYTNGCQSKLNMESLFTHENQCHFNKNPLSVSSQLLYSNSTNMSQSLTASQEGHRCLTTNDYSIVRHPQTGEELVPYALFKDLLREVSILKQICAANFKKRCNNGHELVYESRDANITREVMCDVCKQLPTAQSVGSYRCAACDFDRCEQCVLQAKIF